MHIRHGLPPVTTRSPQEGGEGSPAGCGVCLPSGAPRGSGLAQPGEATQGKEVLQKS